MKKEKLKMKQYKNYRYTVNSQEGFSLTEALKLWKTKFSDYKDFEKEVITNPSLNDFNDFVKSVWDEIIPVTVEDALKQENVEIRRTYFDAIGVETLFKSLEPKLLDKQVIKKTRVRWDDEYTEKDHVFEDVYELYEIEGSKLFEKDSWGNSPESAYAVRCWCTTTNREYWLYVPKEAALGSQWWYISEQSKPDAIRAIAWTVRVDVPEEDIERIYRQGDIIVVKLKDEAESTTSTWRPYHLSKENYLTLMYSET